MTQGTPYRQCRNQVKKREEESPAKVTPSGPVGVNIRVPD